MRGLRLAAALLLLSVGCASFRLATALQVAGTYALAGQNAHGAGYTGRVDVLERDGVIYIRWRIDSGEEAYGVGELRRGTLAVRFLLGSAVGLATFTRRGPDWTGTWSLLGQPGAYAETWTRDSGAPGRPPPPDHLERVLTVLPVRGPLGTMHPGVDGGLRTGQFGPLI